MRSKDNRVNWKVALSLTYLLLQVVLIISARFSDNRYFTWAPHDLQTEYMLEIRSNDNKLNDLDLYHRLGLKSHGWIDLPPNHIREWLSAYKKRDSNFKDNILLHTSVNGREWIEWRSKGSYDED